MPRYHFHNKKTKQEWVDFMMIAEMEEMLEKNPHIRQVLKPINIVSGVEGISFKSDDGWKDVKQKIAEAHPNSSFGRHHRKRGIKEIKTDQAIQRARKKKQTKGSTRLMSKDIPDFMRGFDLDNDWGFTPVSSKPSDTPSIDPKVVEGTNIELSKVKSDVSTIKSMMNEIMQIVNDKETITKEIDDESIKARFKDIEKIVLPFLYNLQKSDEPYIHWPNRGPIIKGQIEKLLKLTRG